jgi:CheY-like chemotaxis protein
VVDDNAFNRSVLVKQLATLGYAAEQAGDAEDALRRWRAGDYAVILADCQMPGMDGFAFARALRAEEARVRRKRVPIVAWTANVMPEDVTQCLDAGMDDVLSKPSALAIVQRVLDTWLDVSPPQEPQAAFPVAEALAESDAPIDRAQLGRIMNGDSALEREMLDGFREAGAREVQALVHSLASADTRQVRDAAHRMKGLARLVAATALAGVCERIEDAAGQGVVEPNETGAHRLVHEWERVRRYLDGAA